MKLNQLTINEARQGLDKKEFTSLELTQACLKAAKEINPKVKALLQITDDLAMQQAKKADQEIKKGQVGLFTGLPIVLKDNMLLKNTITTGGSKILENYKATYNATVVDKLNNAGVIFIGKANLDEFAMGSSTENSAFDKTRNPWDLDRVPGGSSGGSAAAVAADMCIAALGSDTASSIRQPASFCGIVGLKPTYGRVSRYGLIAMTSSLDQIGPLTKNTEDTLSLFNLIQGQDKKDATTYKTKPVDIKCLMNDIKGVKIGMPKEYFIEGMDAEVREIVKQAIKKLEDLGAEVTEISMPLTKYALAVYQIMATSEIATNLARYDGIRYGLSAKEPTLQKVYGQSKAQGFGNEAKRRIILGTFALSAGYYDQYYVKAQKLRVLIKKEFEQVFKKVDCLVTPTTPSVAFKLGEKYEDPLTMYLSDIYTVPANIGGVCAISIPCGFDQGLPVGLQIIAKPFDEQMLFRVANNYEQATDWHKQKPEI
ncbi:Asp-tRNA(Asn)/Glu-tRNA(Gln) amidotransferase subunit GatA [Patescibacteria group bacterium]|nr:Asp-tRNA(Asn)/Glu-tRNA(Gln) amidotransferase subunit GatA [Patescibacteria group bacterium]MBU0964487.1 Asp-tRNA(Asn)/Glu-tRNA(Gln) amidotransferase subunit GatA [Patescibacteria group bacterium]